MPNCIDWRAIVNEYSINERGDADLDITHRLKNWGHKHIGNPQDIESAITFVLDAWINSDFDKLRAVDEPKNPKAYLISCGINLMRDYQQKKYGKPQPPTWVNNAGKLMKELWKSFCISRKDKSNLYSQYKKEGFEPAVIDAKLLELTTKIPRCGMPGYGEITISDLPEDTTASAKLDFIEHVLLVLSGMLNNTSAETQNQSRTLLNSYSKQLAQLEDSINLDAKTHYLLKLCYTESMSIKAAAELVNINARQASKLINDGLSILHTAFTNAGLSVKDIISEMSNLATPDAISDKARR